MKGLSFSCNCPFKLDYLCAVFRVIIAFYFSIASVSAQINVEDNAWKVVQNFEKFHYKPKQIDAQFAQALSRRFVKLLDERGYYFTSEDISEINAKASSLPNDLVSKKKDFFDFVLKRYESKLKYVEKVIDSYKVKTIALKNETLTLDRKDVYIAAKDFESKWDKVITARILRSYFSESDSVELLNPPTKEDLEKIKLEVIQSEKEHIARKLESSLSLHDFVSENYFKAIALTYDPHSDYFSLTEKEEFNLDLSKEIVAFGFSLTLNESNEFSISAIIPGSPAWKSNVLNEDDVIIQAKSDGRIFKFENKTLVQVRKYLADEKQNSIHFWIRKKNGEEIELDLSKEAIDVEENLIESFILEGNEKIAYIYLPSFYSKGDEQFSLSTGCANDVAKELVHLQNEGVSGLIFDLRGNGGGSMLEAILLAGIFVDYGALSIFAGRDTDPETLKDINKGILFDKPMVVLVDQFSASASELFAAAMQDHNRAVIVGSATYGKSTAQVILPLNAFEEPAKGNPEAFIKVTNGAFYRVTGNTHQGEGIMPDIQLPNYYDYAEIKERNEPEVLKLEPIVKKTYYFALPELPNENLVKKSSQRIELNSHFNKIMSENKEFGIQVSKYNIPLSFDLYKNDWLKEDREEKASPSNHFKVRNLNYTEQKGSIDIHIGSKELNEFNIKNIQEDIYIEESFFIINDLIQSQNK